MEVSYSTYDGHEWQDHGTYAEAAAVADDDELWLVLDENPVLGLPHSFNRLTCWPDEEERHTAVLNRREIQETWGDNDPGPLGPNAGLLTIDHRSNVASWTSASGQVRPLYTP